MSSEKVKKRKKITLYVIASSLLIVSAFITYDSVTKLLNEETPDWSALSVGILIVSFHGRYSIDGLHRGDAHRGA